MSHRQHAPLNLDGRGGSGDENSGWERDPQLAIEEQKELPSATAPSSL